MTPSKSCIDLIKQFEGCSLHSYLDQKGIPTIGYGHTYNVSFEMTCTSDQADEWLMEDVQCASSQIDRLVKVSLTQNQHDALTSLVFNIGAGNFERSSLLQLLNSSEYTQASDAILDWCHTHGKVNDGLLRRRQSERSMFLS